MFVGFFDRALHRCVIVFGCLAALSFAAAMAVFPGGTYNPAMRMLSALGRSVIAGEKWPLCHHLFVLGMAASAVASAAAFWVCRNLVSGARRKILYCGAVFNFVGLLTIAAVPENVSMFYHNVGCHLAAAGGCVCLFALNGKASGRGWTYLLLSVFSFFSLAIALHALKVIPFAPAVPSMQKVVILSFAAWIIRIRRKSNV
jgi:hypothetical protein